MKPRPELLEDRLAPAGGLIATGAGFGAEPRVQVVAADTGALVQDFLAYDSRFRGGVRVALADVNGDGIVDVVTAPGPGPRGGGVVKVFSGVDGTPLVEFQPFGPHPRGGVRVATGSFDDALGAEIVTATGGGRPEVRVYQVVGNQAAPIPGPLGDLVPFRHPIPGGVTVAAANFDGAPGDELVVGAGAGSSPRVKVFGADGSTQANFLAFPASYRGGVNVASGDLNQDGRAELVVGAGPGGPARIKVYSGGTASPLDSFLAYSGSSHGGVQVAVTGRGPAGTPQIITAPGRGTVGAPRAFLGHSPTDLTGLVAPNGPSGGLSIAAADKTGSAPSAYQVEPEIPVLDRLGLYQGGQFVPVGPQSIPAGKDVYFIAHGWAPGYLTMVQDNSTPGDPLKWWQTTDTSLPGSPGTPASYWMFDPVIAPAGLITPQIVVSPVGLAQAITQADPNAVVVAYSWIDESATSNDPLAAYWSEAHTDVNGMRLARAIEQSLSPDFFQNGGQLHLIGHSHGSKVVTVAAVALHQANIPVAQVTILDSPESTFTDLGDAANFNWIHLPQLNPGRQPGTTFVDNYVSEFGEPYNGYPGLSQVVDVALNPRVYDVTDLGDRHSYAAAWYAGTSVDTQYGGNRQGVGWSPLPHPAVPPTLAAAYAQSWGTFTTDQKHQFDLSVTQQDPGPITTAPDYQPLSITEEQETGSVSFQNGTVTLSDTQGPASFEGNFDSELGIKGIAFDYQFPDPGTGDQLTIWVDGSLFFVMTGSVVSPGPQTGTLSLGLLLPDPIFGHSITIQLDPVGSASSGTASAVVSNLREFTIDDVNSSAA